MNKTHERVHLTDIGSGQNGPALPVNRSLGAGLPGLLPSPDGKLLVTSSMASNDVRADVVWHLATGKRPV